MEPKTLSLSLSVSLSVSLPSVLSVWVMQCVGLMNKLLLLKCSDLSKGKFEQGADDRRMVVPPSHPPE